MKTSGKSLTAALLAIGLAATPAFAEEAAEDNESRGYEIARAADHSDKGYGDSRVEAEMVLKNAAGQETRRSFSFTTLEKVDDDEGDKSLVIFTTPKDVEGTALLSHAKILTPDDQWLYLPALKRVKRISSANKSGSFVGSEFSFEDFTITELNKFSYRWVREEELDGLAADVVERTPLYEKSGYTKQVSWIDRDIRQARRIEFYDRKDALLKTLEIGDYRDYDGVWRPHRLVMTNHQTGKSTELVYSDYAFRNGLDADDFEQGVLTRIR